MYELVNNYPKGMPRHRGYDQRALQFVLQIVCVVIVRGDVKSPNELTVHK